MTSRYKPNEVSCPVPLDLLALMLRSDATRLSEILAELPMLQRAALAAFCLGRCHMRDLAFAIASRCDEPALLEAAGMAGEMLFEQSRNPVAFDRGPRPVGRKKISLAGYAA